MKEVKVFANLGNLFAAHNEEAILIAPSETGSKFLLEKMLRFGQLKSSEEILEIVEKRDSSRIPLHLIKQESTKDLIRKNDEVELEALLNRVQKEDSILCSSLGFALFLEKNKDMDMELSMEVSIEEIANDYSKYYERKINLVNLDKLIRLSFFFYKSYFTKKELLSISLFQESLESTNIYFSVIDNIVSTFTVIEDKVRTDVGIPSSNVLNKVIGELKQLAFLKKTNGYIDNNCYHAHKDAKEFLENHFMKNIVGEI